MMLPPHLKELIPAVFSGQWLSAHVMGWGGERVVNYE